MTDKRFNIVGIGEILWDLLPTGKQPGGAPANFAYVSKQLGGNGIVASRVGNDDLGKDLSKELSKKIAVEDIQIDEKFQTGVVNVNFENGQPNYEIVENAAWDFLELTEAWKEIAQKADAVCFGSLAQRNEVSRKTIREFVSLTRSDCWRIFDVNLRQNYFSAEILRESLQTANVVKLNHEELPIIADIFEIKAADETERAKNLREKFGLRVVCVTRGANGSLLIAENETSAHAGIEVEIADTVGAGDAFTAAMTHGFLKGWSLEEINQKANRIGAFVASKAGAMPDFSARQ